MTQFDHVYVWKNNEKRATMAGRRCRVVARGRMNSIVIRFEDGQIECVSRYAVRKVKASVVQWPQEDDHREPDTTDSIPILAG